MQRRVAGVDTSAELSYNVVGAGSMPAPIFFHLYISESVVPQSAFSNQRAVFRSIHNPQIDRSAFLNIASVPALRLRVQARAKSSPKHLNASGTAVGYKTTTAINITNQTKV